MSHSTSGRWKIVAAILAIMLLVAIGLAIAFWLRYSGLNLNYQLQATSAAFYETKARIWESNAYLYAGITVSHAIETDNADLNAAICLGGVNTDLVDIVLPACDRAIELSPDNGVFRDYRGLARVITRDFTSAIEDFTFYVDWLRANDLYQEYGSERGAWIAELEAGRDPLYCYSDFWLQHSTFTNPLNAVIDLECRS